MWKEESNCYCRACCTRGKARYPVSPERITIFQHSDRQCGVMLRFFDNTEGKVRFYSLVTLESATADGIFQPVDKLFSDDGPLKYSNLVGLGSDGASVMLGSRNSVLTRLQTEQPAVVSFHCNCHIAALIANHACKVLPDYLDDLTIQLVLFSEEPKAAKIISGISALCLRKTAQASEGWTD